MMRFWVLVVMGMLCSVGCSTGGPNKPERKELTPDQLKRFFELEKKLTSLNQELVLLEMDISNLENGLSGRKKNLDAVLPPETKYRLSVLGRKKQEVEDEVYKLKLEKTVLSPAAPDATYVPSSPPK